MSVTWFTYEKTGNEEDMRRLRDFLLKQDKDELVRLVMDAVQSDRGFLNRLLLCADGATSSSPNADAVIKVIDLVEYAVKRIERAIEYIEDEGWGVTGVLDVLEQLHYDAYERHPLDPKVLGERLYQAEASSDYIFSNAIERYEAVLGEQGVEAYAACVRAAWDQFPALQPGDTEKDPVERRRLGVAQY